METKSAVKLLLSWNNLAITAGAKQYNLRFSFNQKYALDFEQNPWDSASTT